MKKIKTFPATLVATLSLLGVDSACAIPLQFELQGTVQFAEDGNAFGLHDGDAIFGTMSVDALGVGTEILNPDLNSLELLFHVGNVTFSTEQDFLWPAFPILTLTDSEVQGLEFFAFADFDALITSVLSWTAFDGASLSVGGEFAARQTSVPEPGTLGLFAVALIGLAMARLRRSRTRTER